MKVAALIAKYRNFDFDSGRVDGAGKNKIQGLYGAIGAPGDKYCN